MKIQANAVRMLVTGVAMAGLVLIGFSGCSSGVSGVGGSSISANAKSTMTQTLVTDAPADQVLSLALTVESITLTDASGNTATVLSTPVPIEASHLDAVQEPLLPPLNIPQDTYTSATITVANPVVTYVDSTTGLVVKANATLAASSTTVTFNTPITVSATSTPICFDLLVGQSVSISGTTVTVTPTFNVTQIPLAASPTNGGNGKVSGLFGMVVSVSGTNLTIQGPNGRQLTLATNTSTQLQGFVSLSSLTADELVDVDVAQQPDGSLLALRIHLAPAAALNVLAGPVTAVTGSPATSFTQVVRQPLGPSVSASATGTIYTITVAGSTTFGLAPQVGTLPSTPFATAFSAATLSPGQNVAVGTSSVSGTTATAATVTLLPQTVDGTVTGAVGPAIVPGFTMYTVALASQSALAKLTGASSVSVYVNSNTQMMNASAIAVGSTVRFNGLLFNDSGTLVLLAGACNDGPPPAPPQKQH